MSDFEPLDKPSETVTGHDHERWYVEVYNDRRRCLLNACFVLDIADVVNPGEELYYDTESEAYACIEEYYDRHNEIFPYRLEMMRAEFVDGYRTVADPIAESQVMEFI